MSPDDAIALYRAQGFAPLGRLVPDALVARLRARSDELMLGKVVHEGMFFQHDAGTGRYEDLPYGEGWVGPSLAYRKLEKLELDPTFRELVTAEVFRPIVQAVVGREVVLYRAAMFAKQPQKGSPTPFHQDGGSLWGLSEDPVLQIWTALDDAPVEAGCVEAVPGSHGGGLVTPLGGVIPERFLEGVEAKVVPLVARAGESFLVHNHLWHRSGPNETAAPRRAVTSCYMPKTTRCLRKRRTPRVFFPVFGT